MKGNQCLSYTKKSTIVYHLVKKGSPVVSNQKLVHSFLDHFYVTLKEKQHYHPMQLCASWKQMLECNCTNYLTFFSFCFFSFFFFKDFYSDGLLFSMAFFFCHISLVVLDMFELQLVFLIQVNHIRRTTKTRRSKRLDHTTQAAFKMSIMYLYSSCFCFITAFCTWSFASQLILC